MCSKIVSPLPCRNSIQSIIPIKVNEYSCYDNNSSMYQSIGYCFKYFPDFFWTKFYFIVIFNILFSHINFQVLVAFFEKTKIAVFSSNTVFIPMPGLLFFRVYQIDKIKFGKKEIPIKVVVVQTAFNRMLVSIIFLTIAILC